jgi:hypothetical protein
MASKVKKPNRRNAGTNSADDRYRRLKVKAVTAMLTCPTVAKAAKQVGVSHHTLHEWKDRKDFKEALAKAQDRMFEESLGLLMSGALLAVRHWLKVLDPNYRKCNDAVKNQAADMLDKHAFRYAEVRAIHERIDDIERRQKDGNSPKLISGEVGSDVAPDGGLPQQAPARNGSVAGQRSGDAVSVLGSPDEGADDGVHGSGVRPGPVASEGDSIFFPQGFDALQ